MKTTIEIPDATFRQAKSLAGAKGISLKQLFTEALEDKLRRTTVRGRDRQPPWMRLFGAFGKSPAARKETRRMLKRIEEEFEKIGPEELE